MPAPRPTVLRPLAAGAALLALALALAACGGGMPGNASSTTGAGGQRPGGGGFFAAAQDPTVQACLKKAGVAVPDFGRRRGQGRPPATGTQTVPAPPTGTNARPAPGPGGRRFGGPRGDPAQFAKLRAALSKCGVRLPDRGPGGPGGPGGGPPTPATAS